jgi:hypothetical protein
MGGCAIGGVADQAELIDAARQQIEVEGAINRLHGSQAAMHWPLLPWAHSGASGSGLSREQQQGAAPFVLKQQILLVDAPAARPAQGPVFQLA